MDTAHDRVRACRLRRRTQHTYSQGISRRHHHRRIAWQWWPGRVLQDGQADRRGLGRRGASRLLGARPLIGPALRGPDSTGLLRHGEHRLVGPGGCGGSCEADGRRDERQGGGGDGLHEPSPARLYVAEREGDSGHNRRLQRLYRDLLGSGGPDAGGGLHGPRRHRDDDRREDQGRPAGELPGVRSVLRLPGRLAAPRPGRHRPHRLGQPRSAQLLRVRVHRHDREGRSERHEGGGYRPG